MASAIESTCSALKYCDSCSLLILSLAHTKPATSPPRALSSLSNADLMPSSIESGINVSSVSMPFAAGVYTPSSELFLFFGFVIVSLKHESQTAKEWVGGCVNVEVNALWSKDITISTLQKSISKLCTFKYFLQFCTVFILSENSTK